jgi:hypothetical protein
MSMSRRQSKGLVSAAGSEIEDRDNPVIEWWFRQMKAGHRRSAAAAMGANRHR